jgi:hypothetical protein
MIRASGTWDLMARIERHDQKELTQQHEHDYGPAVLEAA